MTVIGVTGTSGKTTTAHLIYEILKEDQKKVSLISTVEAVINGKSFDTGFHVTTPSSWALQRFMRKAKDGGSKFFILEVTSHALDQFRTFATSIDIAVITNISHEHLDYHKTLTHYRHSKEKILKGVSYAVLNADDSSTATLRKTLHTKIMTFGIMNPSDVFQKYSPPHLPGLFNTYNILAATTVAKILNISVEAIEKGIRKFPGISGRLEKIPTRKEFDVYIDFAHKPNALEAVLTTLRLLTKKKLIVVFGCAGLRDRLKRPIMGEIAGRLADFVILTAEDPRTEDVRNINAEIEKGLKEARVKEADRRKESLKYQEGHTKYYWKIPDRQEAINFAIKKLALKGDTVLVTGKGHEKSMCYGKIEYPWNEHKAIEKALYDTVKTSANV